MAAISLSEMVAFEGLKQRKKPMKARKNFPESQNDEYKLGNTVDKAVGKNCMHNCVVSLCHLQMNPSVATTSCIIANTHQSKI